MCIGHIHEELKMIEEKLEIMAGYGSLECTSRIHGSPFNYNVNSKALQGKLRRSTSVGSCPSFSFLVSVVDLKKHLISTRALCNSASEWSEMPEKAVRIPTVKHSFTKPWKLEYCAGRVQREHM